MSNDLPHLSGTEDARQSALRQIRAIAQCPRDGPRPLSSTVRADLRFADTMIARALTKSSWVRNKAWACKFMSYATQNCGPMMASSGLFAVLKSARVPIAFLASVARSNPGATSRVDAAKRAINLLRSMVGAASLDDNPLVKLLSKAARNARARTVRQSPALPEPFVQSVISEWGSHATWWRRQTTLMITLGICTLARGAEIVSCLRHGIAWVRRDGTQVQEPGFVPSRLMLKQFSGALLLFPSRKNKQASPTWIPVMSSVTLRLLAHHLFWLDHIRRSHRIPRNNNLCLFPARRSRRYRGVRVYCPAVSPDAAMSVDSFRALLRQALTDCCKVSQQQAREFGTHSLRIAAVELLRAKGVSSELRQQLGGWMSSSSALRYLQLPVNSQFSILQHIFES